MRVAGFIFAGVDKGINGPGFERNRVELFLGVYRSTGTEVQHAVNSLMVFNVIWGFILPRVVCKKLGLVYSSQIGEDDGVKVWV